MRNENNSEKGNKMRFEIKDALKTGGSPKTTENWYGIYEDCIEFEADGIAGAIKICEELQADHDNAFLGKYPDEIHYKNWDFAPLYSGCLFNADTDEQIEI